MIKVIASEFKNMKHIYALNTGAPKYIKQTLTDLKERIDYNTIIAGDFNTPLSTIDTQIIQIENNKAITGLELYFRAHEPNRHIHNIPSNGGRTHVILKHTWHGLQNRSYDKSQNKS